MASKSLAPSLRLIPLNLLHFFCTYVASNQVFSHHWGQLRLKDEMSLLSTRQFVTSNRESLCKRREKGWSNYSLSCPPPWSSRLCKSSAGIADIALNFSGPLLPRLEAGDPLVILAGAHVGCFELFGADHVRAIRDLKGKTVAVTQLGGPDHVFLTSILAYVGVNPREDIHWVIHPFAESMPFLAEGKIDAVLAFPPRPQELRAQGIGHVVLNSSVDRPWSQYFCCMVYANREFVHKHPMATKRVLRAILKANAICSLEPERVARFLVDAGYTRTYEYALETIKDIGYNRWREYEAEDTIRFYALRLQEAGMIKATPQKIIAQGTDWRFLNELKKELKG
jgi:NitT/TauT family transport system substrate-binding protein